MSANIFQLYQDNAEQVPFVVQRDNWSDDYALVVTSVEITKKRGPYGIAFGYGMPPRNGKPYKDYWGTPQEPKEISCAGCYQWRFAIDALTQQPDGRDD